MRPAVHRAGAVLALLVCAAAGCAASRGVPAAEGVESQAPSARDPLLHVTLPAWEDAPVIATGASTPGDDATAAMSDMAPPTRAADAGMAAMPMGGAHARPPAASRAREYE